MPFDPEYIKKMKERIKPKDNVEVANTQVIPDVTSTASVSESQYESAAVADTPSTSQIESIPVVDAQAVPQHEDVSATDTKSHRGVFISVADISEYQNHVFRIVASNLAEIEESIKEYGVLTPITVRAIGDGRYETLAGHHRLQACKNLGLSAIPCNVVDVDDEQAKIIVVNSNRQRGFTDMKPSEIAFALKMEYDALKAQGKRTDLTSEVDRDTQNEAFSTTTSFDNQAENNTSGTMCQKLDISERNIRNYIRLTLLNSFLLTLVDEEQLGFRVGVELSYLSQSFQQMVLTVVEQTGIYPNLKQATKIKELAKGGGLTQRQVEDLLSGKAKTKATSDKLPATLKLSTKPLQQYLPHDNKQAQEYILKAVVFYSEHHSQSE